MEFNILVFVYNAVNHRVISVLDLTVHLNGEMNHPRDVVKLDYFPAHAVGTAILLVLAMIATLLLYQHFPTFMISDQLLLVV